MREREKRERREKERERRKRKREKGRERLSLPLHCTHMHKKAPNFQYFDCQGFIKQNIYVY